MKTAAEQNRALLEAGNNETITETVYVPAAEYAPKGVSEAAGNPTFKSIRVSRAGYRNLNDRIYPVAVMAVAIAEAQKMIADGMFRGAVDHPGYGGGVLKDSPILWRDLKLEENDEVRGSPEIVIEHSKGKDLMALVRAGSALPFSTRGRGSAHLPSEEEKKKYGLPDDCECVVIINDDFRLIAIDAVDYPSVSDAYMPGNTPPASKRNEGNTGDPPITETTAMKTLAELQTQHPDVFRLHTEAVGTVQTKLTATETKLTAAEGANKALKDAVDGFVKVLAEKHGIQLMKELPEAEAALKIEHLKLDAQKAESARLEAVGKLEAAEKVNKDLKADLEKQKTEQADITRRAAVTAKLPTLFGEKKKWQAQITAQVLGDGKDNKGMIALPTFDVPALESFHTAKVKEYDAIAAATGRANEHYGISGAEDTVPPGAGGGGDGGSEKTDEELQREWRL